MSLPSDLVIASLDESRAVAESDSPAAEWEGFTFNGLDSVKICTLLPLLRSGDSTRDFDRYLDLVEPIEATDDESPVVSPIKPAQVAELAMIAPMEQDEFARLVASWGNTEEFEGWSKSDVADLLRSIGDLAETASLEKKCLFLWQGF